MNRNIDLVVQVGMEHCNFGLCLRNDWLVRRSVVLDKYELLTAASSNSLGLYGELESFLQEHKRLFDQLGKVVVVTDVADRFEASLAYNTKKIGYIRIAQDSHEPEYISQLLEQQGGKLLTLYMKPGESFDRVRCDACLDVFKQAGVTDIAVHTTYQLEGNDEDTQIIEACKRAAPGTFNYHNLETWEYNSFLLTENRLLANVCIRDLLERELKEVEKACKTFGLTMPLLVLGGSGFCMDTYTAMKDPLATWQGAHAAAVIGAATLLGLPEAISLTSYDRPAKRADSSFTANSGQSIVIDRIKEYRPAALGRTKRFSGLQVAGPFAGTLQFAEVPPRHRLLEAIGSLQTGEGALPLLDLTHGLLELQTLEHPIYVIEDRDSACLTGAQSAEFRKAFHCMTVPSQDSGLVKQLLQNEASRWLNTSGIYIKKRQETFSLSKTRYMKTERERMTMLLQGRKVAKEA